MQNFMQSSKIVLRPQEAADRLQIHRRTLFRLLRSNKIQHLRTGTRPQTWRIPLESLEAYLRQNDAAAKSPALNRKKMDEKKSPGKKPRKDVPIPSFRQRASRLRQGV